MTDENFMVEVKGLDVAELPGLHDEPHDPGNCRITVTIRIGESGVDSGDDFILRFATPKWLANEVATRGRRISRYLIVVPRIAWPEIEAAILDMVSAVDAQSWEEFVERFSQVAFWEFSSDDPPD